MSAETRNTKLIIEELSSLQDVIKTNEDALAAEPSKLSLQINLKSLKRRQEELFRELVDSYNKKNLDSFDIVLYGSEISKYQISMAFFGKFTTTFQEMVSSIATSGYNGSKKPITDKMVDASKLNIVATAPGSFRVILSSYQQKMNGSIVESSLIKFNRLVDIKDDKLKIKEYTESLGPDVMDNYKKFLEVLYKNKTNIVLYDKIKLNDFERKEITHELAQRVYNVIVQEQMKDEVEQFTGTITEADIQELHFKLMLVATSQVIKISFKVRDEEKILDNFHNKKITSVLVKISKREFDIPQKEKKPKYELLEIQNEDKKHKTYRTTLEDL